MDTPRCKKRRGTQFSTKWGGHFLVKSYFCYKMTTYKDLVVTDSVEVIGTGIKLKYIPVREERGRASLLFHNTLRKKSSSSLCPPFFHACTFLESCKHCEWSTACSTKRFKSARALEDQTIGRWEGGRSEPCQ